MSTVHRIAILAYDGFVPFDLTMPLDTFAGVQDVNAQPHYDIRVCTDGARAETTYFSMESRWTIADAAEADTVIVPGMHDIDRIPTSVCVAVAQAAARGARIVSICSGSFVLAAAGLLTGRRATTHWAVAAELAARCPDTVVLPNVLYVEDGRIFTSGGATAGLDLCLHLIRQDCGSAAASQAARRALVPLVRDGGQAQFVKNDRSLKSSSLAPLIEWARTQRRGSIRVNELAHHAGVSVRPLTRRFHEELRTTPQKFLVLMSLEEARALLETTRFPIDLIADQCGFNSAVTFRTAFTRVVGIPPSRYRNSFQPGADS